MNTADAGPGIRVLIVIPTLKVAGELTPDS